MAKDASFEQQQQLCKEHNKFGLFPDIVCNILSMKKMEKPLY